MQLVPVRITIVTPSYNQGRLLEPTIRSVVDQEYPSLEYVIIDAGSTDGSLGVLESYSSAVARWVSEPDAGHADGINKGFAGTHGDIMGWINASDIYYPWTLATVAEVFSDVPEAQWVVGMPSCVTQTGDPKSVSNATWNVYDFLSHDTRWLQQESVFWRRSLWEAAGGRLDVNLSYACDFELWTRFIELSPLYHVNLPLAGFRVHDAQRSASARADYEGEAEAVRAAFRKKLGRRECRRARVALTMRSTLGTIARKPSSEHGSCNGMPIRSSGTTSSRGAGLPTGSDLPATGPAVTTVTPSCGIPLAGVPNRGADGDPFPTGSLMWNPVT